MQLAFDALARTRQLRSRASQTHAVDMAHAIDLIAYVPFRTACMQHMRKQAA